MPELKKMEYALLGLLCRQPMTGYDIKKAIDKSLRLFWSGSYGSIYPTLGALVEKGLIRASDVSTNDRAKLYYCLTGRLGAALYASCLRWCTETETILKELEKDP